MKNKDLLMLLTRLFLGYIFFSAGICKLTHGNFGQLIGPPWLEERLAEYGLGLFAQVVAISQVVCGMLLLSQRFSLLGAVMLVPMNVAILAVTVSMEWRGTPYLNAVFLALNLVLLGLEHRKFRFLLHPNQECRIVPTTTDQVGQNIYSWLGIGFGLLTLLMASVNITLTNIFALLAFASFAATIVRSGWLSRLDTVLILLPFLAMIAVTYGGLHKQMTTVILALIGSETILLGYRLLMCSGSKATTGASSPAVNA